MRRLGLCLLILGGVPRAWAKGPVASPPLPDAAGATEAAEPYLVSSPVLPLPADWTGDDQVSVRVRLDVDAAGDVVAVRVLAGPQALTEHVVQVASTLNFLPALRAGEPVSSTVELALQLSADAALPDTSDEVVVVHAVSEDDRDVHASTTVEREVLDASAGADLATILDGLAGVTRSEGPSGTSKPILRGQPERRSLLLLDEIRHEGQKWGLDHAPELDPFAAEQVRIIRGAAGARYGPDAMGGVVLVEPAPLRLEPGVGGRLLGTFSTNGLQAFGAGRIDWASKAWQGVSARIEGNYSRAASGRTPDYVLGNTGSQVWNVGATVGYRREGWSIEATYRHYDLRAGVFYGSGLASPEEFLEAATADIPAGADLWTVDYAIDRPYQAVRHELASVKGRIKLSPDWTLRWVYAYQHNHRREFERARAGIEGPQYDFTLRTNMARVALSHRDLSVGSAWAEGEIRLEGQLQTNLYRGFPLIPNYRNASFGLSAYERFSWARLDVEVGGRFDHQGRGAFFEPDDFAERNIDGAYDTLDCNDTGSSVRCRNAYNLGSLAAGALVHVVPEKVDWKIDLSSASRVPSPDELYMDGTTPTMPVYAVGAPSLGVETTWGGSTTLGVSFPGVRTEVSVFAQWVHNYIQFAPDRDANGDPVFETTIKGSWPLYVYEPVNALFRGGELTVNLGEDAPVGGEIIASTVRGRDTSRQVFLVGVPPDRARLKAIGRVPPTGKLEGVELAVWVDLVAEAFRTNLADEIVPPPAGYATLGASVSGRVSLRKGELSFGVLGSNLTNTRYRSYTSLMRYYAIARGVDVRFRVGWSF